MGDKIKEWFIESPIRFYFVALLTSICILFPLDYLFKTNIGDVIVEFHGLVFDLIVFGLILTIYETFKNHIERQDKEKKDLETLIQRYKDDIDDFRYWHEPEAAHKIVGTIKRLNKLGISNFDLKNCFLQKGFFHEVNLSGSFLGGADMQETPCMGADFSRADLSGADFTGAYLGGANFENSLLGYINFTYDNEAYEIYLNNTTVHGVNLRNANVARVDWFETLKDHNIEGLEDICAYYYIDDDLKEEQITMNCGNVTYNFKARFYLIKEKEST